MDPFLAQVGLLEQIHNLSVNDWQYSCLYPTPYYPWSVLDGYSRHYCSGHRFCCWYCRW